MSTDNIQTFMNSSYGAPELKRTYQKSFGKGMVIAIIIHLFFITTYLLINFINIRAEEKEKIFPKRDFVFKELELPPSATEEELPPVKIEEPVSPPKDLTVLQPLPVAKDKAEEQTTKTQDELDAIKNSGNGDSGNVLYTSITKLPDDNKIDIKIQKDKPPPEKTIFTEPEVEKVPECVNLAQVKSSMNYPEIARQINLEGRVAVKVLVGTDGNVIKVGSLSGPEQFYDEVRDKALNLQFTPGMQNGKFVKVWVTVPFNFKLKN